jgi:hypothetical protein
MSAEQAEASAQPLSKKEARKLQGFELSPARCLNCARFDPPRHGVPPMDGRPGQAYKPPQCGLGGFQVKPSSICDEWQGKGGETLEGPGGE